MTTRRAINLVNARPSHDRKLNSAAYGAVRYETGTASGLVLPPGTNDNNNNEVACGIGGGTRGKETKAWEGGSRVDWTRGIGLWVPM
jgi:hypothetical protein